MPPLVHTQPLQLSRRRFVTGSVGALMLATSGARVRADTDFSPLPELRGSHFTLDVGYQHVNFTGRRRLATTINQSLPAPTLRVREGDTLHLRVRNTLAVDTSIHWHGVVLPAAMDGVPGISFGGIKPGDYYDFRFSTKQHGTYWYHAHSGHQEQTGIYGAFIIDPREPEPFHYDRDHVVLLSDWSDEDPDVVFHKLRKMSGYYNRNERTASDLWQEIHGKGVARTWDDRKMWNQMRMNERDISDVTGYTYTFLMNGQTPEQGWRGLFKKGETVRLRFINAAAMTFFDVRIPGLKMTVVAADGQYVQPIDVDEFRIGNAESYDVLVTPNDDAYTIFAQAMDRSGYARGTLASHAELQAAIPSLDPKLALSHIDMGMDMAMNVAPSNSTEMDHSSMDHTKMHPAAMDHASMHHENHAAIALSGNGSIAPIQPLKKIDSVQIDMMADSPQYRLDDPGVGLRGHQQLYGRRVLTYADLRNLNPTPDPRDPTREIQLHLTGNMHRYLWSIDGVPFEHAPPMQLRYGERVRITLVNNTMMNHPFHLHGMWSDLETGDAKYIPRKHTVVVQPGAKISYLVSADAYGRWAYHCHLMYHMMTMFREVHVV